jgi:hypothetical protein
MTNEACFGCTLAYLACRRQEEFVTLNQAEGLKPEKTPETVIDIDVIPEPRMGIIELLCSPERLLD